jgi:hypothetical protein
MEVVARIQGGQMETILFLILLLFPFTAGAKPVFEAKADKVRIVLYDEPCALLAVTNLKLRAVWIEDGKEYEGCWGAPPGVVMAYFSDKTVAAISDVGVSAGHRRMRLVLKRSWCGAVCTIGTLSVDGMTECFTLEDVVREDGRPVNAWKIPGKTAIPTGTYPVTITYSGRFKHDLPAGRKRAWLRASFDRVPVPPRLPQEAQPGHPVRLGFEACRHVRADQEIGSKFDAVAPQFRRRI